MKYEFNKIALAAMLSAALVGCGGENNNVNSKNASAANVVDNMDASDSKTIAVFDLSSGTGTTVNTMDEYQGDWHFSYQKYRGFLINGGASGEGNSGVEVESCIAHEYEGLYDEQGQPVVAAFEALNVENTLAKFEEISIDACKTFSKDTTVTPELIGHDWYVSEQYSLSIPADVKGWIIQSSDGHYARITPKEYNSGVIFSVETWNGASWDAPLDTPAIDYYMGSNAYYDFNTNTAGTEDTQGWDIYVKKTNHLPEIILAPGASVAYYVDKSDKDNFTYESVAQIDHPVNPTVGAKIYKWDENDTANSMKGPGDLGALEMHGDYTNLNYYPTYTTYILKEANTYYKLQILGYKGVNGDQGSGNIVVRYITETMTEAN